MSPPADQPDPLPPPEPAPEPAGPAGDVLVLVPPDVCVSRSDLKFTAVRSRGPGGQSVNKTSSAMQLRVAVAAIAGLTDRARARLRRRAGQKLTREGEVLFHADTHRSQRRNREACLERLADLVAAAVPEPRPRKKTRPSRGAVERRLAEKKRRADRKRQRGGEWDG